MTLPWGSSRLSTFFIMFYVEIIQATSGDNSFHSCRLSVVNRDSLSFLEVRSAIIPRRASFTADFRHAEDDFHTCILQGVCGVVVN